MNEIDPIKVAIQTIEIACDSTMTYDPFELIESGKFRVPSISRATAGERIPLGLEHMKPGQLRVHKIAKREVLKLEGMVMIVVLKYRQAGMSTYIRALLSAIGMCRDGYNQAMIADTADRTLLMQRIDKGIQMDLEKRGEEIWVYKTSNRRELIYEDSESQTRYLSDREDTVGIGEARNAFHGTEIAYWHHWAKHWGDINPSLHDLPWNLVILESTANGSGDQWHQLWLAAQEPDSDIIAIFLPWYEDPDLVRTPPKDWKPDEWEESLIKRYSLSLEQMYWYHKKLYDAKGMKGNKALMAEKYPFTAEEAFQTSGSIVFDSIKNTLNRLMPELKAGKRGNIGGQAGNRSLSWHAEGLIEVWHERVPGRTYVGYSDVGEGLKDIDKDPQIIDGFKILTTYSTCIIRDAETWELCALMECQYPVGVFQVEAQKLMEYYNDALWGIEIPGPGEAVAALAQRAGYKNLYQHEWRDANNDLRQMKEYGFRNDSRSKPRMEADWEEAIRENPELAGSVRIVGQSLTYIQDPKTAKHRPKHGCFSDLLLADFGCFQLLKSGKQLTTEKTKQAIRDYQSKQEAKKKRRRKSHFRS